MSWTLKAQGYGGDIAFHPGMRTSYNRNNVYPLLGFDRHIALEDLNHPKMLRAYVSDQQDFEKIEQEYEVYKKSGRSNPFYLFNVTIQNHAGYKLSNGTVGSEIAITDDNVREEEAEQYLNLIKKQMTPCSN